MEAIALFVLAGFGVGTVAGVIMWMCCRNASCVLQECAWCGAPITLGSPREYIDNYHGQVSHGICDRCMVNQLAEVDELLHHIEEAS